ncbi:hypothetical protein J7T55_006981 [Diaporthe amygdali]|uniref:uncharacterized protein n=1 Tax=Phomopsis amygdali TaxID=1214568 RepID=UPI0022FE9A4F|nr:uncharacterized protein J7T55_006981 [Diaporthe amygdali]KAJ0104055.1 hypothetical protein J7T55_006981 [Diaporthe amygdali]
MATKPEPMLYDQTNILPTGRLIVVFSALASALLITFIDQQSIGVVLPTIGRDLNSSSTITWAGTSSLIANTAFQVLYGRLSDIFGRKVMLVTCLGLLALGDLLCSFAKTGPQFFAFRGISGVASGGIMALAMMVVIGPFISSAFTERATWRALFWLLCPLAVGSGLILYFLLPPQSIPPEPLRAKLAKIDYLGILFSSAGTILLLIPVSGIGTQFSPTSPVTIALLSLGSTLLFLFVLNEWKLAKLPMVPSLVAAQAHSAKQDRAVVISSRNFLRALGGATGLAIASALFSNTLVGHLDSTSAIPSDIADEIKSSIFSTPNMSGLMEEQRVIILDLYSRAARSVFYFWVGCIGLCWVLMFFIKDKGLQRKEEKQEITAATDQVLDEESGSSTASGDERVSAQGGKKSNDLVTAIRSD